MQTIAALTPEKIKEIEAKTEDLLSSVYGGATKIKIPVDLGSILRQNGLTLKVGNFEDPSISGYYDKSDRTIYISKDEAYPRQLFTIAHEIGHFVLHENRETDIFYRLDSIQLERQDKAEEQEANWFAASLLMPASLISAYWSIMGNAEALAGQFNVSKTAMNWRLKNLGLIH